MGSPWLHPAPRHRLRRDLQPHRQACHCSHGVVLRALSRVGRPSVPFCMALYPRPSTVLCQPNLRTLFIPTMSVGSTSHCMGSSRLLVHGTAGLQHIFSHLGSSRPSPMLPCSSTTVEPISSTYCCMSMTLCSLLHPWIFFSTLSLHYSRSSR